MFLGPERFFRLVILVFRKKNHYASLIISVCLNMMIYPLMT